MTQVGESVGRGIKPNAVLCSTGGADIVQAREESSGKRSLFIVEFVGRAAAEFWKNGKPQLGLREFMQGCAIDEAEWLHDGDFQLCEIEQKAMLFKDLFLRPAAWSIELSDQKSFG